MPRATIKVLVVDDHPAVRWGLVQLLEDQPDMTVAEVATSAEEAVARAEQDAVDVAVIDYHLGGRSGLWATRKLKALDKPPRAVIFSAFANDHLAAGCAVAGADALLSKGSLGDDLCYAIRAVSQGRRLVPRVPHTMADPLRARLVSDEERMAFGMLIAGLRREQIAERLGISMRELSALQAQMLLKLERLPGEQAFWRTGQVQSDAPRLVSQ